LACCACRQLEKEQQKLELLQVRGNLQSLEQEKAAQASKARKRALKQQLDVQTQMMAHMHLKNAEKDRHVTCPRAHVASVLSGYFRNQQFQPAELSGGNLLRDRSAATISSSVAPLPNQATMDNDIDVQDQHGLRRLSAQDAVYSHKHQEVSARGAMGQPTSMWVPALLSCFFDAPAGVPEV
jgi:hypothetical protein